MPFSRYGRALLRVVSRLKGTSNNFRHPGAGRDPVALRSVLARPIRDLSHSENRKPEPLDSGLRRNDG